MSDKCHATEIIYIKLTVYKPWTKVSPTCQPSTAAFGTSFWESSVVCCLSLRQGRLVWFQRILSGSPRPARMSRCSRRWRLHPPCRCRVWNNQRIKFRACDESTCSYPRMQLIRATLATLGFIVIFPSELISLSSGFSVTNSASIATRSPKERKLQRD